MKAIRTILFPILCLTIWGTAISSPTFSQAKTTTLTAPVKVRAKSCQEERLKLTWKKVKGAFGYQIYRYKATAKKFVKIVTVGKKTLLWKSTKTSKKQTYKIRAYKKKGNRKIYSRFSYEVSAIPYKKKAKRVNAGKVKINRFSVSLSSYEGKKVSAQVKASRHAKNKNAKVYDKTIRWTSTNPSIAKIDQKGNITAQGKSGTCKIYARAHNGDSDWLWVRVKAYARPKKFDGLEYMQEDMMKLIQQRGEDLKNIAEFFEKNKANHAKENQIMCFRLDSGRNYVEAEKIRGQIDYEKMETTLFRVLDSFPGEMEIYITNDCIYFMLWGEGGQYVQLRFIFAYNSEEEKDVPGVAEESEDHFETAPRWYYHYSRPQG